MPDPTLAAASTGLDAGDGGGAAEREPTTKEQSVTVHKGEERIRGLTA